MLLKHSGLYTCTLLFCRIWGIHFCNLVIPGSEIVSSNVPSLPWTLWPPLKIKHADCIREVPLGFIHIFTCQTASLPFSLLPGYFLSPAPESCKLEKIGDLSFFQQQDNIVSAVLVGCTAGGGLAGLSSLPTSPWLGKSRNFWFRVKKEHLNFSKRRGPDPLDPPPWICPCHPQCELANNYFGPKCSALVQ